jgi:plastocyanin
MAAMILTAVVLTAVVLTAVVLTAVVLTAAVPLAAMPVAANAWTRPAGHGASVEVGIRDNVFRPARLTVPVGTTVRWSNQGRNIHDVVPNKANSHFGVDELEPGEAYRHRFARPGRFAYYCSFHGAPGVGQHGVITVVKARGDRE